MPDIHTPYNIRLKPILDFCSDWQPDVIQYLGDTTHAESCNHWKESHNIRKEIEKVKDDYAILDSVALNPFYKAYKPAKRIYHIGNHEYWFYLAMMKDLRAQGKYDIESNINIKKYRMQIIPFNTIIHFGYLYFIHGVYTNQYHAAKMALQYRKCIIYGHTHDIQEHMIHSPIDDREKILARSIGCLCTVNPEFMRGKPNKWVNAFHITYIRSDGTFNEYPVIVTDGRFTIDGKTYD